MTYATRQIPLLQCTQHIQQYKKYESYPAPNYDIHPSMCRDDTYFSAGGVILT